VADLTAGDARLSILGEALEAADLTATFRSPGNYTVFAPTNDAFAALLTELGITKNQLLGNKPLLTSVPQYHVLDTRVSRPAIPAGLAISPLSGGVFKIDANGAALVITDGRNRRSNIIDADVAATNGVVHLIDKVLLPADKNIVQTAQSLPLFSILVEAVVAADLQGALSAAGPLTVFAPTNEAFVALLTELGLSKADLLANKPLLTKVLTYHVLNGRVLKAAVPAGAPITTLQGETFTVDAALAITDRRGRKSNITGTDVLASNGVIHVIDRVLLPAP
jgi:uncharacterized surface protein with fasciclin (FAS1) repeats